MQITTEILSLIGQREVQEDSLLVRISQGRAVIAVADGFSKKDGAGQEVSQSVIVQLRRLVDSHSGNLDIGTVSNWFEEIDGATKDLLSGSTLALAVADEEARRVHLASLGDSVAAVGTGSGTVLLPRRNRGRLGPNLWGCFGDVANRRHHSQEPEVVALALRFPVTLLAASDGVYQGAKTAREVLAAVGRILRGSENAALGNLVSYGEETSEDNLTAILCHLTSRPVP